MSQKITAFQSSSPAGVIFYAVTLAKKAAKARKELRKRECGHFTHIGSRPKSPVEAAGSVFSIYDEDLIEKKNLGRIRSTTFRQDNEALSQDMKSVSAHYWIALDEETGQESSQVTE